MTGQPSPAAPAAPSAPALVLRLLLEAGKDVRSGQDMAATLGCSRAAVGKAVAALRSQGLVIDAKPRLGYRLVSEPRQVLPARVEARLEPGSLGLPLIHFAEIDSTNLEARRRAEAGAGHGVCVVAEMQSAGRGRLGRVWTAPKNTCLLLSVIMRPDWGLQRVFLLTNLAALAVCRAVEECSDLRPQVKWPNDVYLDGKKLAGILTEFTCRAERVEFVVVGMGLNVNLTPKQLTNLGQPAASLRAASGSTWDRAMLLAGILTQMTALYQQVEDHGADQALAEYKDRSLLLGKAVEVREEDQVLRGTAVGFGPEGSLLLKTSGGQTKVVLHGDASLRKK